MANDMQWPSEDEDFDAVTTPQDRQSRRRVSEKPQASDTARTIVEASEPDQPVEDDEDFDQIPEEPQAQVLEPAPKPARSVPAASVQEAAPQEIDPVEAAFADDDEAEYYDQAEQEPQERPLSRKERKAAEKAEREAARAAIVEANAARDAAHAREEAAYAAEQAQAQQQAAQQEEPIQKAPKAPKEPRTPGKHTGIYRTIFELLLVVALLGVGYYAVMLHQDKQDLNAKVATLNNNPQLAVQRQTDSLIANVGSLITLPQGEVPTVANVSDAAKAKQQSSFFNNAADGDKVLMYVKAGQAILYRPSTNKIILVAPLTFNSATATTPTTTKTTR